MLSFLISHIHSLIKSFLFTSIGLIIIIVLFLGGSITEARETTRHVYQSALVIDGVAIGNILTSDTMDTGDKQTQKNKNNDPYDILGFLDLEIHPIRVSSFDLFSKLGHDDALYLAEDNLFGHVYIGDMIHIQDTITVVHTYLSHIYHKNEGLIRIYHDIASVSFLDNSRGSFNMIGQLLILPRREDAYMLVI